MEIEGGGRGVCLLAELELLLHQDPLINEVGFVHPSQLAILHSLEGKEPIASFGGDMQQSIVDGDTKSSREASYDQSVFWSGDHKLAISVEALSSLFKTVKSAYLSAYQQYKCLVHSSQNNIHLPYVYELEGSLETVGQDRQTLDIEAVENELMSHSKVLVLLSCDYASAWNSRKQVISQKSLKEVYCTELQLSALVLSYAPKSEQAWSYRYWVIGQIINGVLNLKEGHSIFESESDFVEHIVERSHMNYRAWRHRCRLVNHMLTPQVLNELHRTKKWAESHVGDNCCFHYRQCLLLQLHQKVNPIDKVDIDISPNILFRSLQNDNEGDGGEILLMWKSLWIHRRFLFYEMIQQTRAGFRCTDTSSATHCDMTFAKHRQNHPPVSLDFFLFIEEEFEFIDFWINKTDITFEDTTKQKECAAMYSMWMILHLRQVNGSQELFERVEKEQIKLKVVLENVCPQRTIIWKDVLSI
ncbi:uncharacterized protein LOC131078618 isoform X2 [Cryptomeria japonica]|uniref:uncharacterized protein LOC131078618 isoform X2 n=1 Tax=Cryptomeria japonica TaxID=3369 RepID=UPI0027DA9DE4|nr:uncharacterized protein LOC131078618 isoform X2 [Cryptomeria japonica]